MRNSEITGPECDHRARKTMPVDACRYFCDRGKCGAFPLPLQAIAAFPLLRHRPLPAGTDPGADQC